MMNILAIYGGPRVGGNSDTLLDEFCRGAESAGAAITKRYLRDMDIIPCTECGECDDTGVCIFDDDYQALYEEVFKADSMVFTSPIFFYGLTAIAKAFVDRSQQFYINKYFIDTAQKEVKSEDKKRGYFLSVGATTGKKVFDGPLLNMKYFFDAINFKFEDSFLFRGLDKSGEAKGSSDFLKECFDAGVRAAD